MIRRVLPDEAHRMMSEGWTLVDVRSVREFEEGHFEGAYNVPLLHEGPRGRVANPDFARVMEDRFAHDQQLLLGCRTGARSLRACEALATLGFTQLCDVRAGLAGETDSLGQITAPGWQARNLPVSRTALPGRSWAELEKE